MGSNITTYINSNKLGLTHFDCSSAIHRLLADRQEAMNRRTTDEGFDHVCRYITGLILSPNKTLQGIYDLQRYDESPPSRRAMHQAVFETGWQSDELVKTHQKVIAADHRGKGREVISLDWTLSHHDKGPEIHGVKKGYDYVENRRSRFQTVITATIANGLLIDGLDAAVQTPIGTRRRWHT